MGSKKMKPLQKKTSNKTTCVIFLSLSARGDIGNCETCEVDDLLQSGVFLPIQYSWSR